MSFEREFIDTIKYVSLDKKNDSAYSLVFLKLILSVCSEIDVIFKEYCLSTDCDFRKSYKKIEKYKESIVNHEFDFVNQEVLVNNYGSIIRPWSEWGSSVAPLWWTVYNKLKHNRTSIVEIDGVRQESFMFANQKNMILSLAGLYQILIYFYYKISTDEGRRFRTPLPGSKLFKLIGGRWEDVYFCGDYVFYIDDAGCLIYEYGDNFF